MVSEEKEELYPGRRKNPGPSKSTCSESTKVAFEGSKQPSEHCALHLLIKLVYKHCENIRQLFITRLLLEEWGSCIRDLAKLYVKRPNRFAVNYHPPKEEDVPWKWDVRRAHYMTGAHKKVWGRQSKRGTR